MWGGSILYIFCINRYIKCYLCEGPIEPFTDVSVSELYRIRAASQVHVTRGNQLNLVPGKHFTCVLFVYEESQLQQRGMPECTNPCDNSTYRNS